MKRFFFVFSLVVGFLGFFAGYYQLSFSDNTGKKGGAGKISPTSSGGKGSSGGRGASGEGESRRKGLPGGEASSGGKGKIGARGSSRETNSFRGGIGNSEESRRNSRALRYLWRPPKGFVDLRKFLKGALFEIRYHTSDNFTGAPLPGYGAPGAWMRKEVAEKLLKVQEKALKRGLTLLVYDAYRPYRATKAMWAWAVRTGQTELFRKGYIARRSGHNRGHTIDLTLADLKTGRPLDMGTPWDTLSPASHTFNAKGRALENRLLLRKLMQSEGFIPYNREWWHFRYPLKGAPPRDVPYGCFEPPEGKWSPPKNWLSPSYRPPQRWNYRPCTQ